jgi:hypothetical protein
MIGVIVALVFINVFVLMKKAEERKYIDPFNID